MARESFIIHFDAIGILEKLDNEQAGKLFNAIANYNLTGDLPDDLQTELLLFPFKNQFDRDKKKYENIANRNKSNGSKGGRPKKTESNPEEPKKPTGLSGNPKEPKKPVSVSAPAPVNVSANDNVSAKEDQEIKSKPKKMVLTVTNEQAIKISMYLEKKIIENNPTAKPNYKSWVSDIERTIRIDKRSEDDLIQIIDWIYSSGDFWIPNIMSGKKLREKYDTMFLQKNRVVKSSAQQAIDNVKRVPTRPEIAAEEARENDFLNGQFERIETKYEYGEF